MDLGIPEMSFGILDVRMDNLGCNGRIYNHTNQSCDHVWEGFPVLTEVRRPNQNTSCCSRGWTSTLNETEISWAPALISLWSLIVGTCDPPQAPAFMPSPPWWITSPGTVSQDQSFLLKTAFVRWFGSSTRQAINADAFLHKFQCHHACLLYRVKHNDFYYFILIII